MTVSTENQLDSPQRRGILRFGFSDKENPRGPSIAPARRLATPVSFGGQHPLLRAGLDRLAGFDRMLHRLVQLVLTEFAFREADDDTGNAIADQIGQRAAFAHEFVD